MSTSRPQDDSGVIDLFAIQRAAKERREREAVAEAERGSSPAPVFVRDADDDDLVDPKMRGKSWLARMGRARIGAALAAGVALVAAAVISSSGSTAPPTPQTLPAVAAAPPPAPPPVAPPVPAVTSPEPTPVAASSGKSGASTHPAKPATGARHRGAGVKMTKVVSSGTGH